jgi:hypothetical protein
MRRYSRKRKTSTSPQELGAIGGQSMHFFVGHEECNPLVKFGAVGVRSQEAFLIRVIFRYDVGHRGGMVQAQYPFDILGGGDSARVVAEFLNPQVDDLDRVIWAAEKGQALAQAVGMLLEDGVTAPWDTR